MDIYDVRLTFTEPLLGTAPLNKQSYTDWIASKHPDGAEAATDEAETIEEAIEKGMTGFHRQEGAPFLYDYQIKGFFKDACGMLRRDKDSASAKVTAYKKVIDGMLFVKPRRLLLELAGEIGTLERPLRIGSPQGERVCLACSEVAPEGTQFAFKVIGMGDVKETLLREWLTYGELRGLGQWRNAGYGAFTFEMAKR
jgi:hypothetical protein